MNVKNFSFDLRIRDRFHASGAGWKRLPGRNEELPMTGTKLEHRRQRCYMWG
jgi:hypothetical protein